MKMLSGSMNYMLNKASKKIKQLKRKTWGMSGIEN